MHRYVVIPKEQYISMQQKLLQDSNQVSLEHVTSKIENNNVEKTEESEIEDRELLIGGSDKRYLPQVYLKIKR